MKENPERCQHVTGWTWPKNSRGHLRSVACKPPCRNILVRLGERGIYFTQACVYMCVYIYIYIKHIKGHFTHKPRAMTMKFWKPKRKCLKVVLTHLQNHVVWSQTLKCSVKPCVTGPSTEWYFNEYLFMRVFTHDEIKWIDGSECSECHGLPVLC